MTDSTDNARGPERIFAWKYSGQHTEGQWRSSLGACPAKGYVCCEYIRADLAPDPLRAVKVKPLVWEYHPAGAIAAPPTGFAYIIDTRMKGRVYSLKGFNPQREFSSMDEAKAAAQADYETRIRSALESDPLAYTRVQTMVEALTIIDALDPEGMINGCSQSALTGLVLRMGETARAALAALSPTGGKADE